MDLQTISILGSAWLGLPFAFQNLAQYIEKSKSCKASKLMIAKTRLDNYIVQHNISYQTNQFADSTEHKES